MPYKRGVFRFLPPLHYNPALPLPRRPVGGGYIDRFGNDWQEGPAHGLSAVEGDSREWDVQLSPAGTTIWGRWATMKNGAYYVNVTRKGLRSH